MGNATGGATPTWCPAQAKLQQVSSSATGRCCFNGCDPNSCSDSDWCSTEENCLKPQSQGGCNSNATVGATPTWCPVQAKLQQALLSATPVEACNDCSTPSSATGKCFMFTCHPDDCTKFAP